MQNYRDFLYREGLEPGPKHGRVDDLLLFSVFSGTTQILAKAIGQAQTRHTENLRQDPSTGKEGWDKEPMATE